VEDRGSVKDEWQLQDHIRDNEVGVCEETGDDEKY